MTTHGKQPKGCNVMRLHASMGQASVGAWVLGSEPGTTALYSHPPPLRRDADRGPCPSAAPTGPRSAVQRLCQISATLKLPGLSSLLSPVRLRRIFRVWEPCFFLQNRVQIVLCHLVVLCCLVMNSEALMWLRVLH